MIDAIKERLREPTSRGLARAVGRAVSDGALRPGDRLPSIRGLARELLLSPTTVSAAWSLLTRSGVIRTDGRRGTIVATDAATGPSRYRLALRHPSDFALDLSTGLPDIDLLPDLAAALHHLHTVHTPDSYLDEPIVPELEECLRQTLPGSPDVVTIVDGSMDALDLVVTTVLTYGDRVAVESPCFPPLLDRLEQAGVEVVPVELDDDGPLPDAVALAVAAGAKALFLQPRAQNPTGAAMTSDRAAQLCSVLAGTDVMVVENDSAGAIAAEPLVSLAGALPDRTVHIRSFSKSHGPDLRLAAVAGPRSLVGSIVERRRLGQGWTSRLLQRLLLDLLTRPASIKRVERARAEYARRRRLLVEALAHHGIAVGGKDGVNVWLPVLDESAALVRLASQNIGVAAGSPFCVGPTTTAHVRVTCGLLSDGHADVAAQLATAAARPATTAPR